MLKRPERLRRDLFKNLGGGPRFFHTEHFLLRFIDSPIGPKLGVSVPKKAVKSAVLRNRTRRRVYAALEAVAPTLPKKLYLIIAKPSAHLLKGEPLKRELAELLKKG